METESGPVPAGEDVDYPVTFGSAVMRGRIDLADDVVTLALVGELDLFTADAFATKLIEIESATPRAIVVDIQGLSFIDSAGIRGLLDAHWRALGVHDFAVLNGSGPAHRTLELVGLQQHLLMMDDPAELPERRASHPN